MTLWEQGRVDLDDPVERYIPEFAHPRVLTRCNAKSMRFATRRASRGITIRHLLTHTSGLSSQGIFERIAEKKGVPDMATFENVALGEVVKRMAQVPLQNDPGEEFIYARNTDILGRIIEIVSGTPINEFLDSVVLKPLGMNDTHFYLPEEKRDRLVDLVERTNDGTFHYCSDSLMQHYATHGAQTFYSCSGGLCGTARDYARFCRMVLNGGELDGHRILQRETIDLMRSNQVGNLRGDIGFGFAWDVYPAQSISHSPIAEGASRWGGKFGTDYVIDPANDLVLILLTNTAEGNAYGVNYKSLFHNVVYEAIK